jgi:hypothetical protein
MDEGKLQQLIERQDILDCLTRFCRGMDRFDRALFLSAFHDDATIAAGPFVGGPVALYDWAIPMHEAGQIATHHNLLNHTCEVVGDAAHTETYYIFVGRNRDESVWTAGGRYIDRLERRAGEWKIALRTNLIEWSTMPQAVPLPFADVPDLYANGAPARDCSDPSYTRPLVNVRAANNPG